MSGIMAEILQKNMEINPDFRCDVGFKTISSFFQKYGDEVKFWYHIMRDVLQFRRIQRS